MKSHLNKSKDTAVVERNEQKEFESRPLSDLMQSLKQNMNIPGSPKAGLTQFDVVEEEIGILKAHGVNKSRPLTAETPSTPVPVLELRRMRMNAPTTTEDKQKKVDPFMWGKVGKTRQEHLDRIKLQGKSKTYNNHSALRHEFILKKENSAAKEKSPQRKERTPDGRGGRHARVSEEFLETESMLQRRELHEEKILDLQANFNVLPEKFIEAVKIVDMPKRREHLPNKEWNTRYMRNTVELLPGESCASVLTEKIKQKQASRSIPSDSFSKTAMLNNARSMLQKNHDTYALTDSVSILEASLERGMLRTMKTAKNNRSSILGLSTKNLSDVTTAVPMKQEQTKMLPQETLRCYTEDSRDDMSVGNLSAGMGGEGDEQLPHSDRRYNKLEGALPEDGRSEHVGFTGDENTHAANSTRSGISDARHLTPLELTTGKHSPKELANTTEKILHGFIEEDPHNGGMRDRDDQSLDNSMLVVQEPSHGSPVAPAPSHIEEKSTPIPRTNRTHPDEDYMNSAISTYRSDSIQEEHLHYSSPPPVLGGSSNLDTQSPLPGNAPVVAPNKAADASALKLKELREKIIAQAPSDALGLFNTYMRTDNNPRKFYEGKKKASLYSKYGLISSMRSLDHDISKPSAAELDLLGARKSTLNTEIALFNSLFPDCTQEQRQEFIESSRKRRAEEAAGATRTAAAASLRDNATGGTGEDSLLLSEGAHLSVMTGTMPEKSRTGLLSRTALEIERGESTTGQGGKMPTLEECEELGLDPDVVVWQRFTVDVMQKDKCGPKKILPVLIMKNDSGASSKRFAVNKSKRWGSGVLLQLASQAEEEPIAGPSSYLEILKEPQRRKLREKDRKRITDELHKLLK